MEPPMIIWLVLSLLAVAFAAARLAGRSLRGCAGFQSRPSTGQDSNLDPCPHEPLVASCPELGEGLPFGRPGDAPSGVAGRMLSAAEAAVEPALAPTPRFNVTGFSTYSTAPNSQLSVSVIDDNGKIIPDETVVFIANYTNRSSGEAIQGAACTISIDGTDSAMNYNAGMHEHTASFPDNRVRSYTIAYSVSCTAAGFENSSYSSSMDVEMNATLLSLASSLKGFSNPSMAVAEIDGRNTVAVFGNDGAGTNWTYYQWNGSNWNENRSVGLSGIYYGTAGFIDYSKDGTLDILTAGDTGNTVNPYRTTLYQRN